MSAGGFSSLWLRQSIDWDAGEFRITNCEEANQSLRRQYRKGWEM